MRNEGRKWRECFKKIWRKISGNETGISLHSTHHFTLDTSLPSKCHFTQHITSLNTSLHPTITSLHTSLHSTHHLTPHITSLHTAVYSKHHFTQHITSLSTSIHSAHHFKHNIVIFYYYLKPQQYQSAISQYYFTFLATCFACKQPSSGQNRTKYRYIKGLYCMGSHIDYNYWLY